MQKYSILFIVTHSAQFHYFASVIGAWTIEQDDMKELKRQLRLQTHQVDQIKEELAFKDALVTKVNVDRVNTEKEMENLKVRSVISMYTVSQKNVLTLKRYSSKLQGAILMKFGRNIQNTLE